jgi:hypothetical protein
MDSRFQINANWDRWRKCKIKSKEKRSDEVREIS